MAEEQDGQQEPVKKRMNPEVKAKWLEALRSGKYQQTKHWLRSVHSDGTVGYCCLGVLCSVSGKGEWDSPTAGCSSFKFPGQTDGQMTMPGKDVYEWAGIEGDPGSVRSEIPERLADMNDNGQSFEQIAQYIEDNL